MLDTAIEKMTNQLDQLAQGYQWSLILFRALDANLFFHTQDWKSPDQVGKATGWNERATRMMLDALATQGLLDKQKGAYRNSAVTTQCLLPGAPHDQTHILKHKSYGWNTWERLDEALRSGNAVMQEKTSRSEEELRAFICGMADIGRNSAQHILNVLQLDSYKKMLDVGAGPGTYSIAFCKAIPELHSTLFDLEEVLPIAREEVEAAGLADRIAFQVGDLTQDSLGSGYDLIFVSNIIHSYSEATNRDLVQRCYEALSSGGMLILKDFLVDPDGIEPAFSYLFALHMLVNTGDGDVYTTEQVATWTREAGFLEGTCHELIPKSNGHNSPTRLWCVTKP